MMLPKIPLHLCNQSVVLHMATGDEDDYGKPQKGTSTATADQASH